MKLTLTLLSALLLAPLAVLHAASSADARIVIASEAGAHLDSDVNKGGGTDDTALIQGILDRAPKLGALKLLVDGPILVTGLKVHSNTTIECLNRACGFYLADNSNRPLIANATPQPEGRADRNLSFLGGTYNGNAEHQEHSTKEHGWTTAFSLHGVEQVLFRDVSITNSRTFAVYLTNWRRVAFENIYINLDHIPKRSNQDGIHVQGPGEFLSIRNVQGRAWDDMIALNNDDLGADWTSEGKFVHTPGKLFPPYSGNGAVTDVDIDGVQADDCAQVIRILSRASRLDRVSIRNVKGTYRDFGVWITPYLREGGNIGRVEFENIDLRPVGQRAYDYVPAFLFWIAGKMEQVTLKNISSHAPIDDRPLVWIQPDAKIYRLLIDGLNVHDPRKEIGHTPLIRADGRIALLQVRNVVVQRPQATAPTGSLIGTSMDRSALKALMKASPGVMTPPPGKGMRGWPEGPGYLNSQPQIQRMQLTDVVAEGLEQVLDHQAGTIEDLDLRDLSIPATTKAVHQGGEAKITQTQGASFK
jgi:hypothetical protein